MSRYDCIQKILEVTDGKVTASAAKRIIDYVHHRAKAIDIEDSTKANPTELLISDVRQKAQAVKRDVIAVLNQKARAIKARNEGVAFVEAFGKKHGDYSEGLKALLVGSNKLFPGAKNSIAATQISLHKNLLGSFYMDLKQSNTLDLLKANDEAFDLKVARDLFVLNSRELNEMAESPHIESTTESLQVAKIMKKYQDLIKNRLTEAGVSIQDLDGYITRQTHDAERIHNAGYEQWRADFLSLLDHNKTFFEIRQKLKADETIDYKTAYAESLEKYTKELYLSFISGQHVRYELNTLSEVTRGIKGSLANRIGSDRSIHFAGADAWFEYNKKYGSGTMMETFMRSLERGARHISLIERLGPSPEDTLFGPTGIIKQVQALIRENPEQHRKLDDKVFTAMFKRLTGSHMIPANFTVAKISNIIYQWNSVSKLGNILLSAVSDIPLAVSEAKYLGINQLEAYSNMFKSIFGLDAEARQVAENYGIGLEMLVGNFYDRMYTEDARPGVMKNLLDLSFKLGGLPAWTDSVKTGFTAMLSKHVADHAHMPLQQLPEQLQRVFSQYDITDADWDIIRKGKYTDSQGRNFITLDSVRELKESNQEVETKLLSFFHDRVDYAIMTPGMREQAELYRNIERGTLSGELFYHLLQFKSFPYAMWNKISGPQGRNIAGTGHSFDSIADTKEFFKSSAFNNYVAMQVQFTMFGLITNWMRDLFKGKEPRPASDSKTWTQALLTGGGLGFYGDFLFGEYNRYGNSFVGALAGPTVANIESLVNIRSKAMHDSDKEGIAGTLATDTLKLISDNLPMINIFYARAAYNYLFFYQLQELINPGYTEEMERGIMEKTGQKFLPFARPSKVVPSGHDGNWNILERDAQTLQAIQEGLFSSDNFKYEQ